MDSGRLKVAERALSLLFSRGGVYVASTWLGRVPVIAWYEKMWQKWCCTSFWMQTAGNWQHLPPAPWKTPLDPWAAVYKVWLSWQCHAGDVSTRRCLSQQSRQSTAFQPYPWGTKQVREGALHSSDQPICQVSTAEGQPLRQKRKVCYGAHLHFLTHKITRCNQMITVLKQQTNLHLGILLCSMGLLAYWCNPPAPFPPIFSDGKTKV